MAKINIKIEGVSYQVEEGMTILEAAKHVDMRFHHYVHLIMANVPMVLAVFV